MKISTKRFTEKQMLTISLVCGGVLLLGLGGLLYMAHTNKNELNAKNGVLRSRIGTLETQRRQIPRLQTEIASLEEEVRRNAMRLPSEEDVKVSQFLDFVSAAADGTAYEDYDAIALDKFGAVKVKRKARSRRNQPKTPVVPTHFKKHGYNAKYRGTFYQFGKFINIIEEDDRFMSITAFKVEQPKKDPKSAIKDFFLKIGTYTYTPDSPASSTGGAQ